MSKLSKESLQRDVMELKTQKKNKQNHGIGLRNVKETIDSLGGKLEMKREADSFSVKVTLTNELDRLKSQPAV